MKLHRLIGMIAAAVSLGAIATVAQMVPLAGQDGRSRQLRILKDCGMESGIPGSDFCTVVASNLPELPAGTRIYYNQIPASPTSAAPGPTAGPGYLDSTIFVFVNTSQWAVGRCTVPFDNTPGLCTLSDGFGRLAGITARIKVTYSPGGNGFLYAWDGPYDFNRERDR